MGNQANLSIGSVAKRTGVTASALHFYEAKGLISSERDASNQRRYHPTVIRRVSIIKAAQKLGLSLENIKNAFASLPSNRTPDQKDWQKLSMAWQEELDRRIASLQRLSVLMNSCIGCGCLSMDKCPLYNQDDHLSQYGPGPVLLQQKEDKP